MGPWSLTQDCEQTSLASDLSTELRSSPAAYCEGLSSLGSRKERGLGTPLECLLSVTAPSILLCLSSLAVCSPGGRML